MPDWVWIVLLAWLGLAFIVASGVSRWFRWMREQDRRDAEERFGNH